MKDHICMVVMNFLLWGLTTNFWHYCCLSFFPGMNSLRHIWLWATERAFLLSLHSWKFPVFHKLKPVNSGTIESLPISVIVRFLTGDKCPIVSGPHWSLSMNSSVAEKPYDVVFPHLLAITGFWTVWISWQQLFLHSLLCPVWILWCWVRWEPRMKAFPHCLHL